MPDADITIPIVNAPDGTPVSVTGFGATFNPSVSGGEVALIIPESAIGSQTSTVIEVSATTSAGTGSRSFPIFLSGSGFVNFDVAAAENDANFFVFQSQTGTYDYSVYDSATPVTQLQAGTQQYMLRIRLVDTNGVYAADGSDPLIILMDVDVGSEAFHGNVGIYNYYLYTPPTTLASNQTATFTVGKYAGPGTTNPQIASVARTVQASSSTLELAINIPSSPVSEGSITAATWESMTNNAHFFSQNTNLLSVVSLSGKDRLSARHTPSSSGSPRNQMGGSLTDRNSYTVTQTLNFEPGFDFGGASAGTQVGKCGFGIAGGRSDTPEFSGQIVSGGDPSDAGWSVRPAWTSVDQLNELTLYCYFENRVPVATSSSPVRAFGENLRTGLTIVPGQDIDFSFFVQKNTPGQANGIIRAWVNGAMTVNRTDIRLMVGTPLLDTVFFATFHGGGGASAPSVDRSIRYCDISYAA